jgi:hypothetical protein
MSVEPSSNTDAQETTTSRPSELADLDGGHHQDHGDQWQRHPIRHQPKQATGDKTANDKPGSHQQHEPLVFTENDVTALRFRHQELAQDMGALSPHGALGKTLASRKVFAAEMQGGFDLDQLQACRHELAAGARSASYAPTSPTAGDAKVSEARVDEVVNLLAREAPDQLAQLRTTYPNETLMLTPGQTLDQMFA